MGEYECYLQYLDSDCSEETTVTFLVPISRVVGVSFSSASAVYSHSSEAVPVSDAGFDITSPEQQEFLLNVSTEARWRADLEVRPSVLTWIEVFRKRHRANFPLVQDAAALFSQHFSIIGGMRTAGPTSLKTFSGRGCSG